LVPCSYQSCKSGRAFRVGRVSGRVSVRAWAGFELKFVKPFLADFGPAYKPFYNISSNNFLLSWRTFVVLTAVTSVSEVVVTFLQLILFANTAAFFCSLLGLASHSFWEGDSGEEISTPWRCFEEISHSRDSWLSSRNDSLQTGFSCSALYYCR